MDEQRAELQEEGRRDVAGPGCCGEGETETFRDWTASAHAAIAGWTVSESAGCYGWKVTPVIRWHILNSAFYPESGAFCGWIHRLSRNARWNHGAPILGDGVLSLVSSFWRTAVASCIESSRGIDP